MLQKWLSAAVACMQLTVQTLLTDSWPPNSPDMNPLDYRVWGSMLQNFWHLNPQPKDIRELKSALVKIWDAIYKSITHFRKRLQAYVNADGGHFQHLLEQCWLIWLMFAVFETLKAQRCSKMWPLINCFINFTAMFSWNICINCSILLFQKYWSKWSKLVLQTVIHYSFIFV